MHKNESQPADQLLSSYFMLIIQNQRLNKSIEGQQERQSSVEGHYIRLMNDLQQTKNLDRRIREQKILQLNKHIRQLHLGKEELSKSLDSLKSKYNSLQSAYYQETNRYKQQIFVLQKKAYQPAQPCHDCEQARFKQQLEKKQKQQLQSQIQRLYKVTIRELQSNIELLSKQNQSYMTSITSYRTEVNNYKAEKNKLEDQISKLNEQIDCNNAHKLEWQKQINLQKLDSQRFKQNYEELSKRYKCQIQAATLQTRTRIENLMTKYQKQTMKFNQIINSQASQISAFKQQVKKQGEELQRKSKKLKQYDDQYAHYVNKMTNNHNELMILKAQNNKFKEKCFEAEQKTKQIQSAIREQHNIQMKKISAEYEKKLIQVQQKSQKQNAKQTKMLEVEIEGLKNEIQTLSKEHQHKYNSIQKQRDKAILQWKEIANQMKKQKDIISSLEKQIEQYHKHYSDRMRANITDNKIGDSQIFNARSLDSARTNNQPPYQMKTQNNNNLETKNQHENESISKGDLLKEQDKYLLISKLCSVGTIQKNGVFKTKQSSNANDAICCNQCLNNSKQSSQKQLSNRIEKDSYRSLQIPRHSSRERQNLNSKYCVPHEFSSNSIDPRLQLRNINDKIPLSYKRKDDKFRKYQMNRTKTEEVPEKENQITSMMKNVEFFSQKNGRLSVESINNKHRMMQERYSLRSNQIQSCQLEKPQLRDNLSQQLIQKALKLSSSQKNQEKTSNLEIQQYLSFDLNTLKSMTRSKSEKKIQSKDYNQVETTKQKGFLYDFQGQKNALSQKINNIPFFRDEGDGAKQTKFYNFNKKVPQQMNLPRRGQTKVLKENINEIIHRKCQFLRQQ